MSEPLTADQIYDIVKAYFPGEEGRVLHRLGVQAPQLRADLAANGGDLIGVTPPAGYTEETLNALLAEMAASIGGGGVTDHGALTGLADDDHPQYLTEARGDARYDALGAASSAVAAHVASATAHPASSIQFSDASRVFVKGANVQAALEAVDQRGTANLSTGIVNGGVGSVVGGVGVGTTVNVTAGVCHIIDNTNPASPVFQRVTFGPFSNVAVANTGVILTWWYIDMAGALQQQTTKPTPTQYRTRAYLFRTGFTGGVISSLVPIVNPLNNTAANLGDLARAVGIIYRNGGGRIRPNGANLNLNRLAGALVYWGGGYAANFDDPHEVALSAQTPLTFRMINSSGGPETATTTLPVATYDVGGTTTAIPGSTNRASIFTVFQAPSGNVLIQRGSAWYNSINDALAALANVNSTLTINPALTQADTIIAGYIVARSGATSLNVSTDAVFIDTNKFGELSSGAVTAGIAQWGGILGTLSNQTDLQAALNAKLDDSQASAFGLSLLDDANAATARATLGLGAAATQTVESIRLIPQTSQSAAYTLVLTDQGKHILHPSADTTARTFTIPANSSVAFPIGTAITFVNQNGAGTLTIAITTDTMRLAGAGTTGSRTLAANGIATALKVTSTEWIISGTGLT